MLHAVITWVGVNGIFLQDDFSHALMLPNVLNSVSAVLD
jgi:hypothetical protein